MLTALAAAVVNLLLNILLIPKFQVYGAAIATAAAYFVCFMIRIYDTRKFVPFNVDSVRLGLNIMLILVLCLISVKQVQGYYIWAFILFLMLFVVNLAAFIKFYNKIFKEKVTRIRQRKRKTTASQHR